MSTISRARIRVADRRASPRALLAAAFLLWVVGDTATTIPLFLFPEYAEANPILVYSVGRYGLFLGLIVPKVVGFLLVAASVPLSQAVALDAEVNLYAIDHDRPIGAIVDGARANVEIVPTIAASILVLLGGFVTVHNLIQFF